MSVRVNHCSTSLTATAATSTTDPWSGFYKKSLEKRHQHISGVMPTVSKQEELSTNVADNMIENCIGTFGLPLGLGLNFKVNGKDLVVPMATEEPSVIAAVSGAAKTIAQHGGFTSAYSGNIMVCQVQLLEVPNVEEAVKVILNKEAAIIEQGNLFCESIKRRGGGVIKIIPRVVPYDRKQYFNVHEEGCAEHMHPANNAEEVTQDFMLIVNVHVDVCEAMGANITNTVAEGLSPYLVELVGGRAGLQIISNYAVERRAIATFRIPVSKLAYKDKSGEEVARGILEAYAMACSDSYRAVTHNKGIMNGIDAAAIALGQDFRAIESGAHAWAARSGTYQPLTHYRLVKQGSELMFEGTLELPVPIGVRGGAVQSHPTVKYTHELMENPDCSTLGGIMVSVGLAQNFAALRAMSSEGIQRGHMALHSKNIAIQTGVPAESVAEVSAFMVASGVINAQASREYLEALEILKKEGRKSSVAPSTLYVSTTVNNIPITHVTLYESLGKVPSHLSIKPRVNSTPLQSLIFGHGQLSPWLSNFLQLVAQISVKPELKDEAMAPKQIKVQMLATLIYQLAYNLLKISPVAARDLLQSILNDAHPQASSGPSAIDKVRTLSEYNTSPIGTVSTQTSSPNSFHEDGLLLLDPFFLQEVESPKTSKKPEHKSKNLAPNKKTMLKNKEEATAFKEGAPLLLSLWSSLRHILDNLFNDSTSSLLSEALKNEVLAYLARLLKQEELFQGILTTFTEFLEINSSRLMVPFFLLTEMISLPISLMNSAHHINHLLSLGRALAWRATVLEDLNSHGRDSANQLNNSYLFWLQLNGKSHEGEESIAQFDQYFSALFREQLAQISGPVSIIAPVEVVLKEKTKIVRFMHQEFQKTSVSAKL